MIVGFGFVGSDRYKVVACLLGLGLGLQGFDWLCVFCWVWFCWRAVCEDL